MVKSEGELGMNLKELRATKNMSQKELAKQIGVSQAYVCALELGKRKNPSIEVIRAIARELNVDAALVLEAIDRTAE